MADEFVEVETTSWGGRLMGLLKAFRYVLQVGGCWLVSLTAEIRWRGVHLPQKTLISRLC